MNETIPAVPAAALDALKAKIAAVGGVALLIGVEDYRSHRPDGSKDLPAGRNDVLAYWKVCRRLGYKPEHIRVLTSPELTAQDLLWAERELSRERSPSEPEEDVEARVLGWLSGEQPKVILGEATRDAIMEGVEWLAKRLVATVRLQWESWKLEKELVAFPGLLTYSGHGARREGDLALCPSDVGKDLERAISFDELRKIFDGADDIKAEGTPHPTDNLTIVLDCCFAARGPALKGQRVPSLTSDDASPGKEPVAKTEIGNRVFCAAGRDEQSCQAMLGGYWYSAFTWAFTVALEQWTMEQEGAYTRSTISHAELLFRARTLLKALSFRQHPMFVDKAGIGNLPVFYHDSQALAGDETSAVPNAERPGVQIDPSTRGWALYLFHDGSAGGPLLAAVVVTNTASPNGGWEARKEYWNIAVTTDTFNTENYGDIIVTKTVYDWTDSLPEVPPHFSRSVDATWRNQQIEEGAYHLTGENNGDGFRAKLTRDANNRNRWTGSLEWVRRVNVRGCLFASKSDKGVQYTFTMSPYMLNAIEHSYWRDDIT